MHHVPQHIVRSELVFMAQHIADACHFRPRNACVPGLQRIGQVAAGFREDFNAALYEPALAPVSFEGIECYICHLAADKLDGLDDVREAWDRRRLGHQNTCNADASILSRRTGCKLRRVMMSVLRSRIRAAAAFTSINSKSPSDPT